MARPNVKKQIELPAPGANLYGVECFLRLVASIDTPMAFGYSTGGDVDVAGVRKGVPSSTGLVTFTSVRANSGSDGITSPAGTVYELVTKFADGSKATEYISVPNTAGDVWVQDILTTMPSALPAAAGSMTGAEILTALLAVDGAGSGLDADLLDGLSSAAFVAASTLTESVQDVVGAMVVAGANVTATYDDAAGTLTIAASGLTESVQDIVGAFITGISGVTTSYDDAANTLTISIANGAITDTMLAGSISQSKVTNLVSDLAAKQSAAGLTEAVQDVVGAFTSATGGLTVTYDDTANTLVFTIADGAIVNTKLTTNPLLRSNHSGDVVLPTSTPTSPAAVALHSEKRARDYVWLDGPNGAALPAGDAPWARTWVMVTPNAGTSPRTQGTTQAALTATGTVSHPTPGTTTTGIYTNVVTAASTNVQASIRTTGPSVFRGASSDVYAGFEFRSRVRFPDASYDNTGASTGSRLWGLALFGTGPSTLFGADRGGTQDLIGFCRINVNGGATDTNWQLVTCDNTTTTTTNTALPFVVGNVYQFALWCPAGATSIEWRVENISAGTNASGAIATTLPRTTTALDSVVGLLTVDAVARNVNIHRIFLATDKG